MIEGSAFWNIPLKYKKGFPLRHRAEIDGLRAVAVIPVILFHAGFERFSGGFVGVDIFFVISGYLITTIILSELNEGKFSILNFYERRARRILPALFIVLLTCLPFAWLWLVPSDMKSFSQSVVAVSLFASNILFWRTSGYFDTAAELKPLLHTWSLAVEEQYYVIFPIFLLLAWRLGRRWILASLIFVAVLSLAAAQILVAPKPAATFYLLPTRGWELAVGAFVAFYFSSKSEYQTSKVAANAGASIGLVLIAYSIFFFSKQTPFPSLWALFPTSGAALIILFANDQNFVGRLLSSKAFVVVGLVSYSAYLWHQPLFAFARSIDEPSNTLLGALALSSLLLAYFSWKYVEAPFRDKSRVSRKNILVFSLVGSLFFATVGLTGHFTKGFEGRISSEQAHFLGHFDNAIPEWKYFLRVGIPVEFRFQCDFYDIPKYRSGYSTNAPIDSIAEECYVKRAGAENILFIWGDSHAQQLYPGLKREMPADWQVLQVTSSGCEARLNASPSKSDYCEYSNWFAYKTILETHPDVVVVGQDLKHSVSNMLSMSQQLKSIGVKKVVFTGPSPHWTIELPKLVVHKLWVNTPHKTLVGVHAKVKKLDNKLKSDFPVSESVRFVSLMDYFCDEQGCDVYYGDNVRDGITTWDYGHLTPMASHHFARDVLVREIVGGF